MKVKSSHQQTDPIYVHRFFGSSGVSEFMPLPSHKWSQLTTGQHRQANLAPSGLMPSVELRSRVAEFIVLVFASHARAFGLRCSASSRGSRTSHVEFEANLLPQQLAHVGVVLPPDRMVEGVALDLTRLRFGEARNRLPVARQGLDADRSFHPGGGVQE